MGNIAIYGNMGSEKTHELLRLAIMYRNLKIPSTIFKWVEDRKLSGESDIKVLSRSGLSFDNVDPVKNAKEIINKIEFGPRDAEVFYGIPDVHLYRQDGAELIDLARRNKKDKNRTIAFEGLDRTYKGEIFPFGNSGFNVFHLYGLCTPKHMTGKCFYVHPDGKPCKADAEESLRLLNGMPCPTDLDDIPLVSPGSETPNVIIYNGKKIHQSWLGVCGEHHLTGTLDEIAEQIIDRKLNFPQPIPGLEEIVKSGNLGFYKHGCGVWLPNPEFKKR